MLDINFNLNDCTYKSYRKQNNIPIDIKNIPLPFPLFPYNAYIELDNVFKVKRYVNRMSIEKFESNNKLV